MPRSRPGDFEPVPDKDGTGPKFAELFDIYLMSFSGDARVVAAELERAFRIEASAARRLVAQLPVVVKRRVEPDLAAQYFDVLASLGVQVVLLPSPQSSATLAPPPVPDVREAEPDPEVSFDERRPRATHGSEPAPEVSFEPMPSATLAQPSTPATQEFAFAPEELDLSMPSREPSTAPVAAVFAEATASVGQAPDSGGATAAPSVTTMRELPRLGTTTVVDSTNPFETMPPPAAPNATGEPLAPWSMTPPEWGVFEKRDPRATLVASPTNEAHAEARAPSFPPLPPSAPAPTPGAAQEESWLNPLPKQKSPTRDPGSGLFMAENADDFIGAGPRTTQTVPLPVIKPLRERPASEAPLELPPAFDSLPPPARLPPPPAVPAMAAPAHPTPPRPSPPGTGGGLIKPSIPPPVPLSARTPTMSRRPPPVFDSSGEDPSVLRLEFDKVPPLPSGVSIAPIPPHQIDVDPGDLASLPRIELQGVRDTAARAAGTQTPVPKAVKRPLESELASLPPLQAPRAPTPAPAARAPSAASSPKAPSLAGVAAPKAPSLAGVATPVGGKGGAMPPPVPVSGPTRPERAAARGRLGKLQMPEIPDGVRRAAYALGLIGCAVAIFAFGVRVDSSILYGNASVPAVLLHSFAMYAVGAGILGMFRS